MHSGAVIFPESGIGAGMPLHESGTHLQLLAVAAREIKSGRLHSQQVIRVLDVGCGDGRLIAYLATAMPVMFAGQEFEFYGFDVDDHGVQPADYFRQTAELLSAAQPLTDWRSRLALISERDSWPYADGSIDVIVSNQVLEHVIDHDFFFGETARVLAPGGFAVHVFPSKHCLVEPHLHIPLVHRFKSENVVRSLIMLFTRLRLGIFSKLKMGNPDLSAKRFSETHTDFIVRLTNFKFEKELHAFAKRHRLHSSFKYTPQYYAAKIRSLLGLAPQYHLSSRLGISSSLAAMVCRYIASSTFVVQKRQDYIHEVR